LENFLLPVADGDKAVCFALTEIGAGSDATAIKTNAVLEGDSYRINGSKRFITGGSYADFGIVMAVTDPDKGTKGISSFLVDLNLPGVKRITDYEPITGKGGHADFLFEDCVIPKQCLLGREGDGFKLAMSRVTQNRLLHCAVICGLARRSFESALRYSTERTQFGRRLADFQVIQHKLAKMNSQLFAIWSMTLHAAHLTDQGENIRRHAAMCKYYVAETGFSIADESIQVHGGIGIMKGHLAEWVSSMLRMYRIGTGTSEIQLNTIAKELLKGSKQE
jgi:alkylation response protein AidB-like acyl-CoA dehydrogenase